MEDKNKIDELFQKGSSQNFPYDENLWNAVEPNLPAPSKGFFYKFRKPFGLITLFTIVGLGIYFMSNDSKRKTLVKKETILSENEQSSNQKSIINSTIGNKNKSIKSHNKLNNNELISNELNKKVSENNEQNKNVINSKSSKEEDSTIVEAKVANNQLIDNNSNSNRIHTENKEYLAEESQKNVANSFSNLNSRNVKKDVKETQVNNFNLKNEDILSSNLVSLMKSKKFSASYANESLALIRRANLETNSTEKSILDKIEERMKKNFKAVEFEGMRSLDIHKTVSKGSDAFLAYKGNSEQSLSKTQFGINFINQYQFLTYGIGLNYVKYFERVNYKVDKEITDYEISYDTTYQLINSNYVNNGEPVLLIKEVITENRNPKIVIIDDVLSTKNTFKRVQLPVFVGVQKNFQNISVELLTALVFNYLLEVKGVSINENLDQINELDISQMNKLFYSNSNSLSISYALNESFGLGLRYQYDLDITSFTKNYDSKLKAQNAGIFLIYQPK